MEALIYKTEAHCFQARPKPSRCPIPDATAIKHWVHRFPLFFSRLCKAGQNLSAKEFEPCF